MDEWVSPEIPEIVSPERVCEGDSGGDGGPSGYCGLAGLRHSDCLKVVGGNTTLYLTWVTNVWTSGSAEYDYGEGSGPVEFWYADGDIHLSVDGLELLNCGNGCFMGGALTGHAPQLGSNSSGFEPCNGSTFTLCVSCVCCSIAGWGGPGWYCVEDTGPEDCVPVELLDADRCDDGLTICSGPYPTEELAEIVCGGDTPPPLEIECQNLDFTGVQIRIYNKTGACVCMPDTLPVFEADIDYVSTEQTDTCEFDYSTTLFCNIDGIYYLNPSATGSTSLVAFSADPISLTFIASGNFQCGTGGGSFWITFEVP